MLCLGFVEGYLYVAGGVEKGYGRSKNKSFKRNGK